MKLWVKILIACVLSLIAVFSVFLIVEDIEFASYNLKTYKQFKTDKQLSAISLQSLRYNICDLIAETCLFVLCAINIILLFKKMSDIKQQIQDFTAQQKAKKKQKLQEKLDKMEKGE